MLVASFFFWNLGNSAFEYSSSVMYPCLCISRMLRSQRTFAWSGLTDGSQFTGDGMMPDSMAASDGVRSLASLLKYSCDAAWMP